MIQYEFDSFRTAIMFYTRIPVGKISNYSDTLLSHSTRYFPFIGWVVGGVAAGIFALAILVLPLHLALLLSMSGSIFLTGAFHEDGFADFCDGFGGGYTPERILDIMKDSRNGTYATVGVGMLLLTKFYALSFITIAEVATVYIAGHAFSRLFPVLLIYSSNYVRLDLKSKAKPIGKSGTISTFVIAFTFACLPLYLIDWHKLMVIIPTLGVVFFVYRSYVLRKLGGYTGDILGALQQLCEVFFYLAFIASST